MKKSFTINSVIMITLVAGLSFKGNAQEWLSFKKISTVHGLKVRGNTTQANGNTTQLNGDRNQGKTRTTEIHSGKSYNKTRTTQQSNCGRRQEGNGANPHYDHETKSGYGQATSCYKNAKSSGKSSKSYRC